MKCPIVCEWQQLSVDVMMDIMSHLLPNYRVSSSEKTLHVTKCVNVTFPAKHCLNISDFDQIQTELYICQVSSLFNQFLLKYAQPHHALWHCLQI